MFDKLLSGFFFVASVFLLVSHVDAAAADAGSNYEAQVSSVIAAANLPSSSSQE